MRKNNAFTSRLLLLAVMLMTVLSVSAQRVTDLLDRGLVAMRSGNNVYVSWRIQADEYYDVKYNLYRNGVKVAENLTSSNFLHTGVTDGTYEVRPVLNGQETTSLRTESLRHGGKYATATTWATNYFEIPMANVQASNGVTIWKQSSGAIMEQGDYQINDVSVGDIDGDGKMDFIVKRINQWDANNLFPTNNTGYYSHIECYASSINYDRMWWIDCGPNICFGADKQWDAVAYDWNQDGVAEVLYRGGAGTVLHHKDGTTETIGSTTENIRGGISHVANMTFSNSGEEWLIYIDGRTGKKYHAISYPLARGAASDWGDGYGHRSSKYFMGAPFLDGKKPYIFLGRGIYTKIMACTYTVNERNELVKVGNTWNSYNNTGWYGQGYHNFAIADVDEDGCDEIVYGSMVLDFHTGDNSLHGMASTGLGHGDASHTGDLDPFRKGLETFACNEDDPAMNYRNAATCEIYARMTSSGDDGRSMAGNFTNEYPGGIGASTASGIVPLSYIQPNPYSPTYINGMTNNWNGQTPYPMALNFRIYWDGDLLSETINGPGSNESYLYVDKLGARIFDTNSPQWSTACINYTKKNPCASGDIFGDWREEIVMRTSDNKALRIYTTNVPTEHRMQSLWYDHQYRQAMVWQTEGYNQPPHPSFFVGELEGLTQAPPALTWEGRMAPYNGSNGLDMRGSQCNGKDVLIFPGGNGAEMSVYLNEGSQPRNIFLVANTTIEGGDKVKYTETKHTWDRIRITGFGLSGATNLCKQGDAAAHLPYMTSTHTGKTDVWAGALIANGSFTNSPIWANRFSELYLGNADAENVSTYKSLKMEYGSRLFITDHTKSTPLTTDNGYAKMRVGELSLKEGAVVEMDVKGTANADGDKLYIGKLNVTKRYWSYGPPYSAPVFRFNTLVNLTDGQYEIGTLDEMGDGELGDVVIEVKTANASSKKGLVYEKATKKLYLYIGSNIPDLSHVDVTPHPMNATVVGPENNKVGFHTQFSPYYTVENGQTVHLEYINYNEGNGQPYENGVFMLYGAMNAGGQGTQDMTSYINNPTCSGTNGTEGAPGWICTGNGNMPYRWGNYFENWIATPGSANFDYYQVLNVPNGVYQLSAEVFIENAANDNENGIYASSNGVEVHGGSFAKVERENNAPVFRTTSTPTIEVTDGMLRIGFKSFGPQTASWSVARNFSLAKVGGVEKVNDVTSTYVVNAACAGTKGKAGATGWTCTGTGNMPYAASDKFENWNGTAANVSFDYYQDITVPNGKYKLSASAYTNGATQANEAGIYAKSGAYEVTAGTSAGKSDYETITTGEIEVTNGKLRIGFKNFNVASRSATWNLVKDFKLYSVGGEEVIFALSADEHSWGEGWDKRATTGTLPTGFSREYISNWGDSKIASYMNGARVSVDVTYKNATATYESTVTSLDGQHTRTDKFVANNIEGDQVRFRFTVENSHIAIDNDTYDVKGVAGKQTVAMFHQDFEDEETWTEGWTSKDTGRLTFEQYMLDDESHAIFLKSATGSGNNGTYGIYTFPDMDLSNALSYELNFDFAQTSIAGSAGTTRNGNLQLKDANGNLLVVFRAYNQTSRGEVVVGATASNDQWQSYSGGTVVGGYAVTAGVFFTTLTPPTNFVHVKIRADKDGKMLLYVDDNEPVVIAETMTPIKSMVYVTDRYAGQMMVDDIFVDCEYPTVRTVKTNANGYATFGDEYLDMDFTTVTRADGSDANDFKAYRATKRDEQTILYIQVDEMFMGEGVLIKGAPNTEYTFYASEKPLVSNGRENMLYAGDGKVHEGCFGMSTKNGVTAFRKYAAGVTVNIGKAYLKIPAGMSGALTSFSIEIDDDEATSIGHAVKDDAKATEDSDSYTIIGYRTPASYKGVVVRNGQKQIK